jgi:hydroxymethylbilane synthase
MAVHSLKDLPAWLPEGLVLSAVLPREDPRDALLSSVATSIATLPHGARVGTSSPRRRALLFHQRPDLDIVEFRGNVGTRLAKLEAGEVDATMLAVAGMKRLGLSVDFHPLDVTEMLPAGGQGAIGLESRIGDSQTTALCAAIGDEGAAIELSAERALQYAIDGSCRTPMGVLARLRDDQVTLDALVARVDGSAVIRKSAQGSRNDAARLGAELGQAIKAEMPPDFFAGAAILNG